MTAQDTPTPPIKTDKKTSWTTPLLEPAGTIDDVKGGAKPGLDSNNLPAKVS